MKRNEAPQGLLLVVHRRFLNPSTTLSPAQLEEPLKQPGDTDIMKEGQLPGLIGLSNWKPWSRQFLPVAGAAKTSFFQVVATAFAPPTTPVLWVI